MSWWDKLSPDELSFCQQAVATYKAFSEAIWHGDQYRLADPWTSDVASVMYVDSTKKSAILFNYLVSDRYDAGSNNRPVALKGLDASKMYMVSEINLYPGTKPTVSTAVYSGNFLMTVGINPGVREGRTSVVIEVMEK